MAKRGKCPPYNTPNLRTGLCEPSGVPIQWLDGDGSVGTQTIEPQGCPEGVPAYICHQPCENFQWDDELLRLWRNARAYGMHPCTFYKEAQRRGKFRLVKEPLLTMTPEEVQEYEENPPWQEQFFFAIDRCTRGIIGTAAKCILGGLLGRPCPQPDIDSAIGACLGTQTLQPGEPEPVPGPSMASECVSQFQDAAQRGDVAGMLKAAACIAKEAGMTPAEVCQLMRDQGLEIENCEQLVAALMNDQPLDFDFTKFILTPDGGGAQQCGSDEFPVEISLGGQTLTVCAKLKDGSVPGPQIPKEVLYLGGGLLALMALAIVFND